MDITPASEATTLAVTDHFQLFDRLTVRQKKKWVEILLSFELTNKYDVYASAATPTLRVEEQGGGFLGFLLRIFLSSARPFRAHVIETQTGRVLMHLHRRFRFIFHRLEVMSGSGEVIGAVERKWSWLRRIYDIQDAQGRTVLEVFGPFWKPWTFELRTGEQPIGMITKRWSGLGKELFTDADNFGIEMQGVANPLHRALAFAALVLIDVVHFERAK